MVVEKGPDKVHLGVRYSELIPVIIESIKDIHKKISSHGKALRLMKDLVRYSQQDLCVSDVTTEECDMYSNTKSREVDLYLSKIAQKTETLLKIYPILCVQFNHIDKRNHSTNHTMKSELRKSQYPRNLSEPLSKITVLVDQWEIASQYDKNVYQKRWMALGGKLHLKMLFENALNSID
jgi:uncharacterized protein YeeX (DUF496 family)